LYTTWTTLRQELVNDGFDYIYHESILFIMAVYPKYSIILIMNSLCSVVKLKSQRYYKTQTTQWYYMSVCLIF